MVISEIGDGAASLFPRIKCGTLCIAPTGAVANGHWATWNRQDSSVATATVNVDIVQWYTSRLHVGSMSTSKCTMCRHGFLCWNCARC